jgi:hypothetical protein
MQLLCQNQRNKKETAAERARVKNSGGLLRTYV